MRIIDYYLLLFLECYLIMILRNRELNCICVLDVYFI